LLKEAADRRVGFEADRLLVGLFRRSDIAGAYQKHYEMVVEDGKYIPRVKKGVLVREKRRGKFQTVPSLGVNALPGFLPRQRDLMVRIGHAGARAALIYQHTAQEHGYAMADAMGARFESYGQRRQRQPRAHLARIWHGGGQRDDGGGESAGPCCQRRTGIGLSADFLLSLLMRH